MKVEEILCFGRENGSYKLIFVVDRLIAGSDELPDFAFDNDRRLKVAATTDYIIGAVVPKVAWDKISSDKNRMPIGWDTVTGTFTKSELANTLERLDVMK